MFPSYPPLLRAGLARIALAALLGRRRSFREDALSYVARLDPPPRVLDSEHVPHSGPCVLTVNHYSRPGFGAWWLALSLSALAPVETRWIMTAGWTYPGQWKRLWMEPLTHWAFTRLARTYGFISMPPMPPRPHETLARARAVREALTCARHERDAIFGIAPEGGDAPGGKLSWPPAGAGRFLLNLARLGFSISPVGAYEAEGALHLRFGPPYRLGVPEGLPLDARDHAASQVVMESLARLLPQSLRGEFN
jgi:hypothetical protein